jgi:ABC-type lipoprotein release transport system permease subunit
MYLPKLMFRSLLRHQERGRRLAVLVGLCVAAIILLLAMMDSFYARYVQLFIDTTTAHLSIVPAQTAELKRKPWKRGPDGLQLLRADRALLAELEDIVGVAAVSPIVRTAGEFLVLSGEPQGGTVMVGIAAADRGRVFPGLRVTQSTAPLGDVGAGIDVPVLRRAVQFWETTKVATDTITAADLRVRGADLARFADALAATFPHHAADAAVDPGDEAGVLRVCDAALADPRLYESIPEQHREPYDWRLEEAIAAAQASAAAGSTETVRQMNKQLLAALFPVALSPVTEAIRLMVPMSFQTSPASDVSPLSLPVVVPITFVGFVEAMPLYGFESFMDIAPLRRYLKLDTDAATEIAIRVRDPALVEQVKERAQAALERRGRTDAILDYREMGAGYLPTAVGIKIALLVLVVLFVVAVAIFVINMILLTIIKRRREIGTAIALGMRAHDYALLFLGELTVIVTIAWVGGTLLGSAAVGIVGRYGMPGVIFFHGGLLYLDWSLWHCLLTYLLVMPTAVAAAILPLVRVLRLRPVDVLRETR